MTDKEFYMNEALKEAQKAFLEDEIPIGAVIVKEGKIIARAHNQKESFKVATSHAEILAINEASKVVKDYRLLDCEMYVTLEPCIMCAGAIIAARIPKLIYAANDFSYGAHSRFINIFDQKVNHKVMVESGILEEESSNLIKDFFKKMRIENKMLK